MIQSEFEDFIQKRRGNLMTPVEDLALFIDTHNVEHVMLLLANVGYSRVPVISKDKIYLGTIATTDIIRYQKKHHLSQEQLASMDIALMVNKQLETLKENYPLEELMHKMVDAPFLPVLDASDRLLGIITRKSLLKVMNALLHTVKGE